MSREKNDKTDVSKLLHILNEMSFNIDDIELDLNSRDLEALDLSEASSQKIKDFSSGVGNFKDMVAELQAKLEEANVKVIVEKEYSSKLQGAIGSLEGEVSSLRDEEAKMSAHIEDLHSKLSDLNSSIIQREIDKENLDNLINQKEDEIVEKNKHIIEMKTKMDKLTSEISNKENQIQEQNQKLENLQKEKDEMDKDIELKGQLIEKQVHQLNDLSNEIKELTKNITEKEGLIKSQTEELRCLDEKVEDMSNIMMVKEDLIQKQGEMLEETASKLVNYEDKEKRTQMEFSNEERFIVDKLQEKADKTLNYKILQSLCEEKFEGVRLILKKLKEKGVVDYEGEIPMFNSNIRLIMLI